jgi:lipoate-protein ligase A
MKYFDFTAALPAENLACDEALLDLCEAGKTGEILRFWEPKTHFVVLGYANQAAREANLETCQAGKIPVLRRCSGGGTVLQGPGCLNYSLVLMVPEIPASPMSSIASANEFIMHRHQAALQGLLKRPVRIAGHTDLTVANLKFSGNAQRRHQRAFIFHGTFLLNFDLSLVERFLPLPSKQPTYRENRSHGSFLTTLNIPATDVKIALKNAWEATDVLTDSPAAQIKELSETKYSRSDWNFKF